MTKIDTIGPADFLPPVMALFWWAWWGAAFASNSTPVATLPEQTNRVE